jgi:hypothetical protein
MPYLVENQQNFRKTHTPNPQSILTILWYESPSSNQKIPQARAEEESSKGKWL